MKSDPENAMLNRLHIQNYKCLLDVTIELGGLTVLIGPNDSGKSSFLEALRTLGRIGREPFAAVFAEERSLENLVWRKDRGRNLTWDVAGTVAGEAFAYSAAVPVGPQPVTEALTYQGTRLFWSEGAEVLLGSNARRPAAVGMTVLGQLVRGGKQPYVVIADELASTVEYRFEPEKLVGTSFPQPNGLLHPSGDNLAGVLDTLLGSADRPAFEAIETALHASIPTLNGIAFSAARNQPGAKALDFILPGNGQRAIAIPGRLASTGALLLTAYLTLAHTDTPSVVLVEEPENGLHPSRLGLVIDLFRKMSMGEVGHRKRQVVLTTHSPLLLNYIRPEEVRVFVRDPERGTQVTPMASVPDADKLLKEFSTGELWYLLGEEKLTAGSPA